MGIDITTYRIWIGRFDRHCWNLFIFHHWVGYSLQDASNYGVINVPIEMLRDDSAGRDNARCLYVCGNCQGMANVAIYVNLHTTVRAVRPSTRNVVRNRTSWTGRFAPWHFGPGRLTSWHFGQGRFAPWHFGSVHFAPWHRTRKFRPRTFLDLEFRSQDVSPPDVFDLGISHPDVSDQVVSPPDIFGPGRFAPCLFGQGNFAPWYFRPGCFAP